MFCCVEKFNQSIGNWDVSSVTDMTEIFNNAKSFNQDISSWNISSKTAIDKMYYDCPIKAKYKAKKKKL